MATCQALSRINVFELCESFITARKSSFMAWNLKQEMCKLWIISIIYIYIYIYIYNFEMKLSTASYIGNFQTFTPFIGQLTL